MRKMLEIIKKGEKLKMFTQKKYDLIDMILYMVSTVLITMGTTGFPIIYPLFLIPGILIAALGFYRMSD